jgi:hypothetical protein
MKYILVLCMLAFVGCATVNCVEENGKTTCDKGNSVEKRTAGRLGRQ